MNDLVNLIQREIDRALTSRHHERVGLVTSYDPKNHAAKVTLQPEGFETGWLPIHGHHVGNGWGMVVGLQVNDQVRVSFQEGDLETGAITARIHSDEDKPPEVKSGEMLLKHQSGAQIKFAEDKTLTLTGSKGDTLAHDADGGITATSSGGAIIKANADGSGSITDASGATVFVKAGKIYLGSQSASLGVMLQGGVASTKIFGVA